MGEPLSLRAAIVQEIKTFSPLMAVLGAKGALGFYAARI